MKTEGINVTINGDVKEPIEIILRDGRAGKIVYPVKYQQSGLITAPIEFSKRISDKSIALVEYSVSILKITFFENPKSEESAIVSGSVTINPDLVAFGINKDKYFKSPELIKFVRKYAHCFKSLDDAKELISNLQNIEVKFEQTYVKGDDRKGNSEESVKNAIKYHKGEIKTQWNLSLPLFLGFDNVDVSVEVEIDRDGTTPVFGFYSIDIEVLIKAQSKEIIDGQISQLKEFTCLQLS